MVVEEVCAYLRKGYAKPSFAADSAARTSNNSVWTRTDYCRDTHLTYVFGC